MRHTSLSSWLLLATAFALGAPRGYAGGAGSPALIQSFAAQNLAVAGPKVTISLGSFINNPTVPGTAVRISVTLGTQGSGHIDVALTDQQTPLTVANFLAYVNSGAYTNNFVHRSVPGFIIQDGGFFFLNSTTINAVPAFAPVQNEFGISNTRGTIAMAKLGSDPNSATSQWFINLADNSANLNNQNGGFTVFGNVIGNTMTMADAIAAVPTFDVSAQLGSSAFTNLPLTPAVLSQPSFIQTSVAIIPGLTFTASAANGSLVTVSLSGNSLRLTPSAASSGNTTVTVTASALDGGQLTATFSVAVGAPNFTGNPASAAAVAGQTATFSVAATGVPQPTLQWQSAPAGSGTFSNLANSGTFGGVTTATLSVTNPTVAMSGTQFRCVAGNSVSSGVTSSTATLTVTPAPATVTLSSLAQTFTGTALPVTVTTSPVELAVTVTYGGITTTAPTNAGSYPVLAVVTDGNHTGSASGTLVINPAAATVSLSGLAQTFDGSPHAVTVTTSPAALAVTKLYNGGATVPSNAGSYAVTVTISDGNHTGSASGTLVINPAAATVTLSGLAQTFDGSPHAVTVTTSPAALAVTTLYNGSATAPSNAGSYSVTITISDSNHTGSAAGTLVVAQAAQTITFGTLATQLAGTAPLTLTATASSGLTVTYTTSNPAVATASGSTLTIVGPGTATITALQLGNANYLAAATVAQTLTVQPTFASFAGAFFTPTQLANPTVSGPTANPAGDGLPNLLKYAFNLDPTQSNATAGLPGAGTANGSLTLTFIQRTDISDITYLVEVSGDLLTWSSGPSFTRQVSATPIDAQRNRVTVQDLIPLGGTTPRFIRLRVTQP